MTEIEGMFWALGCLSSWKGLTFFCQGKNIYFRRSACKINTNRNCLVIIQYIQFMESKIPSRLPPAVEVKVCALSHFLLESQSNWVFHSNQNEGQFLCWPISSASWLHGSWERPFLEAVAALCECRLGCTHSQPVLAVFIAFPGASRLRAGRRFY